jgi:hypothetical protein
VSWIEERQLETAVGEILPVAISGAKKKEISDALALLAASNGPVMQDLSAALPGSKPKTNRR